MNFDFATAGRVLFGPGRAAELAGIVAEHGSRALVCTGSDPGRHADLLARLTVPYVVSSVDREPTVESARAATAEAREFGADVVVAIGGGSPLDLGKAVAVLLANGGDPLDYLEVVGRGQALTRPAVPCVAVPTTAGTGSEVTANAVLTAPEHGVKASLRSPHMLPRVALVDPLLTLGCPPSVTASSGLDALTQCLEPFVSVRANPVTDAFARDGLRRAGRSLRAAHADGANVDARTDMMLCSLLGGLALANAKLGAVHGFASAIGGLADVPHGLACAALLVPVTEANIRALRARDAGSPVLRTLRGSGRAADRGRRRVRGRRGGLAPGDGRPAGRAPSARTASGPRTPRPSWPGPRPPAAPRATRWCSRPTNCTPPWPAQPGRDEPRTRR